MSDKCKCGAHLSAVWNFATCPVCEKLELRAEIERLRGKVEKLKERIRNANNAYAKLWDEVERLQSENEGYAKSYDALSDELAAERQRARLPGGLMSQLRAFRDGDSADHYDLLRDILEWYEQKGDV